MKNRTTKTKTAQGARKRDLPAMRNRRHRAMTLLAQGNTKAQAARLLGVTRQSVGRWAAQHARGGAKALAGARKLGRKPKAGRAKTKPRAHPGRVKPCKIESIPGLGRRHPDALRRRRHRAITLLAQGNTKARTARLLGVSNQSVGHWERLHARGGRKALAGAAKLGRKPKVGIETLKRLKSELLKGAPAHGYANSLWTLERVREVLARKCGVSVHRGHVWRVLREMNWSVQRPQAKARERDEEAIGKWKRHTWARIKKSARAETLDRVHG